MHMKKKQQILLAEAARYTQLAKESALKNLLNHGNGNDAITAREHLVRAETFKAAAALIA